MITEEMIYSNIMILSYDEHLLHREPGIDSYHILFALHLTSNREISYRPEISLYDKLIFTGPELLFLGIKPNSERKSTKFYSLIDQSKLQFTGFCYNYVISFHIPLYLCSIQLNSCSVRDHCGLRSDLDWTEQVIEENLQRHKKV